MTWVNPLILWALPIGLIPLLIHLLIRQRLPRINWPAMEFVLLALKKNRRRILLQTWILLLIRTLVLIVLVLLIARPVTQGAWSLASGERNRSVTVIIVDDSCSMAATDGVATSFERARNRVMQVLEELGEGSRVALILAADPPQAIIPQPTRDFAAVKDELERREPRDGRGNYEGAIEAARSILEKETEPNREVILVTDGQASGWEDENDALTQAADNLNSLSHVARFVLLTPPPPVENSSITLVEAEESFVSSLVPANYRVLVRNHGESPVADLPLELFVDGDRVARRTMNVASTDEAAALFSYRYTRRGMHTAWGKCGEDALDRDNARYVVENVHEQISTLIVEGRPAPDLFKSESGFLRHALAPRDKDRPDAVPLLDVHIVESTRLSSVNLRTSPIIILAGVDSLSTDYVNSLKEHVAGGAGLFIIGSSELNAGQFEAAFCSGENPLLPLKLGELHEIQESDEPERLIVPEMTSRRLAAFENAALRQQLSNVGFRKFRGIAQVTGRTATTLAAYTTGEAALVEIAYGAGTVLFLSCGANREGSDFPVNAAYVPFFKDLTQSLMKSSTTDSSPGEDLIWKEVDSGELTIVYPDGGTEPASPYLRENPASGQREVHFTDTSRAGIYALRSQQSNGSFTLTGRAVNVPLEESILRTSPPGAIRDRLGSGWMIVAFEDSLRDALRKARFGSELWPMALLALGALVFAENILARLFSPKEVDARSLLRRAQGV